MKAKNIYKMGMWLSVFIAFLPLIFYIVAHIFSFALGCGEVVVVGGFGSDSCYGYEIIASLFIWSWFIVISLPLGIVLFILFYLLYLSVRRR